MSLFDRLREKDDRERWERQNNIKLEKEYKMHLDDGKLHSVVPVQKFNNGKYYGIVIDDDKYALVSAEKLKKLVYEDRGLNTDVEHRDAHYNQKELEEISKTQDPYKKDALHYSSITIYDVSDDGDRYDSRSIPVIMDSRGNIFNRSGSKFSRTAEELKLDLENDTGKFYEDWMHARGEPITAHDKIMDGIDTDVAYYSGEGQTVSSGLQSLKDRAEAEGVTFTTPYYTPEEIEQATEELEERDERWEN